MIDTASALRIAMLGQSSITTRLLPQSTLPSLATAPIFAHQYPRLVTGAAQTGYTGHDWAALLKAQAIQMVLITPSGRVRSGGDESRVPWSRPRLDVQSFGRTEKEAFDLYLVIETWLKALGQVRAVMSGGTALISAVTVEGGPISFPDPETEAPETVGIYAASAIEEYVA